ncbi:inorganic diphosphatase [Stenotrophomonas sp. JC08]|uniref:inorganic diphosphatase n=1 Tax=Stenotrophomonas sp. JC08 TaxID=3445779 RepID=UPI003FA2750B
MMLKRSRLFLPLSCLLALLPGMVAADADMRHPLQLPQPSLAPDEVLMVVEIPAGGTIKYELGRDGELRVDRFLSMPVAYPANYGSLPRTLAGDGDPLDALVLTRSPVQPGATLRFRPLGVLRMHDRGEADEKIIGVPVDVVAPAYRDIRTLDDLPLIERQRIEAFFRVYKDLPDGGDIRLEGWGDVDEAREVISRSLRRHAQAIAVRPAAMPGT